MVRRYAWGFCIQKEQHFEFILAQKMFRFCACGGLYFTTGGSFLELQFVIEPTRDALLYFYCVLFVQAVRTGFGLHV